MLFSLKFMLHKVYAALASSIRGSFFPWFGEAAPGKALGFGNGRWLWMELNYLLHQSVSGFIMQTCHRKLYIKMTNGPFNSGIWKVTGAVADTESCVHRIHQGAFVCGCDAWQATWGQISLFTLYSGHIGLPCGNVVISPLEAPNPICAPLFAATTSRGGIFGTLGSGEWTRECKVMASVFPSENDLGLSSLVIS